MSTCETLPPSGVVSPDTESTTTRDPARLLLERRQMRRSFKAWCVYMMKKRGMAPALHHLFIIDTIQALLDNKLPKRKVVMLTPPGAAKSTYTSVLLPPWYLNPERNPADLILACSYSYDLIEGFGRQCRDIIEHEGPTLGYALSDSAKAAGNWRTTLSGGYFCAGVNAGIAGHRARLGFIDDYIGSQEEADSETIRKKNWEWYWNDFSPRLWPDSFQFIIANRRHEDDLVGRLLAHEPDSWHVIRLPMEAEDNDPLGRTRGELLWPQWFTQTYVSQFKKLPRTWAGLYQQRPAPEEGNFFKKDWIMTYGPNDLPTNLRLYVGSDYALRKGQDRDSTCFIPAGLDDQGRLWILPDFIWEQLDTLEAVESMFTLADRHKPLVWWAGRENITGSIGPFINEKMMQRGKFIPIEELSEAKDKEQKAQSIKARMSARSVYFPNFVPRYADMVHQLLTFPAGTHDDFVDALAKLGQGLDKMVPATKVTPAWDGVIPEQRVTCGWMVRSHRRREREIRRMVYS